MKRFTSILMIFVLMLTLMSSTAVTVLAADGDADNESAVEATDDLGSTLAELKTAIKELVLEIVDFVKSDETYTNVATAMLAVLAILFLPLILGVVIVALVIVVAMESFVGAMVKMVEIILALVPSLI